MNSFTLPTRLPLAAILGFFLLSGCANILKQYYQTSSPAPIAALLPYSGKTRVYSSANLANDSLRLLQDGYVQIGIVSFKTSGHVTAEQIQDIAGEVGADIVLCSKVELSTHQAVEPFVQGKDGKPGALNPYVHVDGSLTLFSENYGSAVSAGGGGMDFKGNVTASGIPGISAEEMAAINARRYDFTATFWRKIRSSLLHSRLGRA